ncbi:MAG TPA: SPASM domain-containing protein [Saprospiraceae bacterium]|nr:SPASM domain-containing protein [Saprospiraceae bacterium]HMP24505.1 SPASM domain-containing protein [Saprospiraceae bacterium]
MKKLRTSLYTIFVDLKDNHDYCLIVHGYTGAIDKISGRLASKLKRGLSSDEIENGIEENLLDRLINRGYVTDKTPLEEKEVVKKMAQAFHKRDKLRKNFMFLVAYDCNFRCPYCFENAVSNNGKGWSKKVFTKNAVDKAFEAMTEFEPNRQLHSNTIILYGGEPLLEQNHEIVKYIVEKGVKEGYNFRAITNGYDLDCFENLLHPNKIGALQITLDGVKEKHNNRRTHYEHGDSFDKIIKNIAMALNRDVNVSVRINTELNNFDDLIKIKDLFTELNFFENKKLSVYSALIHGDSDLNCNTVMTSCSPSINSQFDSSVYDYEMDPFKQYIDFEKEELKHINTTEKVLFHDDIENENDNMRTMNRGLYIRKYFDAIKNDETMKSISCQDFGIRQKITKALKTKGLIDFRSVFCSAQTGELIFDPYGDLYTCWETVGIDQYKVGTYRNGINFNEEELENWYGRNISTTPACSKCKYAFFCGGGCQAHALQEGRGFNSPYCDGYPKMFHEVVSDCFTKFEETTLNH